MIKNLNLFAAIIFMQFLCATNFSNAQTLTQNIRGNVIDAASCIPIPYANVYIAENSNLGTVTDTAGNFSLQGIPVGRHTLIISSIGYESAVFKELLVTSAKETYIDVTLNEIVSKLDQIVVTAKVNKQQPLNKMAGTGARMLSVEEASRYAGGMDDPARLASTFSGVSSDGCTNGISIHGNAPHLLLWKIEGVEIPNPNHYADISIAGGGIVNALSSLVIGNSDFYTSTFPAEYGNAISGVFDIKLRNGNNEKYEHTFRFGTLGIDFASEGPFSKKSNASYIINYRYSSLGLASKLGWIDMGGQNMDYQDVNMKINIHTKNTGTFSFWATGLIDKANQDVKDTADWETTADMSSSLIKQYMGSCGFSHKLLLGNGGQLKTNIALTHTYLDGDNADFDIENNMCKVPNLWVHSKYTNLIFDINYTKKFNSKFTTQNGFTYTYLGYNMFLEHCLKMYEPMSTIYDDKGSASLQQFYTSNMWNISDKLSLIFGANVEWLSINKSVSFEPRASLKWKISDISTFAFGYGLHSRKERTDVYFVKDIEGNYVNQDLDFTKAHHFMTSYSIKLGENALFKIEPFYQKLFNVPVEDTTSFSIINFCDFYIDKAFVNKGEGVNYGVDFTLERYLKNGLYGMTTASFFNSEYKGGDGVWRNSRYNRKYIVTMLGGKEWMVGKTRENIFGINARLTLQGGERYAPIAADATFEKVYNSTEKSVPTDETQAFKEQLKMSKVLGFSIRYTINRKKVSHSFIAEVLSSKGFYGHVYNLHSHDIEPFYVTLTLPNISYKIEF